MKRNELISILFVQAWWENIIGDEDASTEIVGQAMSVLVSGVPFAFSDAVH